MVAPNPIATALRAFLQQNPQGVRERVLVKAFVELSGLPQAELDSVIRSFINAGWVRREIDPSNPSPNNNRIIPEDCIL